jgi:cytochrome c556
MNVVSKLGWAALCALTLSSVGRPQDAPATPDGQAQAAVRYRKALFDVQEYAYLPMKAFLRGSSFDAMAAETAAARLEVTSSMIPGLFKLDTRKFHVTTRALDGIWADMSDFQQKALELHQAAMNLDMAAKSGDADATKRAAIGVGKACGACHDKFRSQ